MSIVAAQCRGARAVLGWSEEDLARHAGLVSPLGVPDGSEVRLFEQGEETSPLAARRIEAAFISNGVIFTAPAGVNLGGAVRRMFRPPKIEDDRVIVGAEIGGVKCAIHIAKEILADLDHGAGPRTPEDFIQSVKRHQHLNMDAAHEVLQDGQEIDFITLTWSHFDRRP